MHTKQATTTKRKASALYRSHSGRARETRLGLSPTAIHVLKKRYLLKDKNGNVIETPEDMFRRIARNIALADKKFGASDNEVKQIEDEFFSIMNNLEFISGMALRNAGRNLQQLSACYVLPLEDSMESIYTTLKEAAFLHKTGAGIGYDFSKLRPRGSLVKTTGGSSCGPVGFMKLFDFSCHTVVYNAATRRPGNMGILSINHPDIEEFISVKNDNSQLNNFNISVSVTDEFMEAVKSDSLYDLIDPVSKKTSKTVRARELFNSICEYAWSSAEPGMIFIDRINEDNPTPHIGKIDATNQCGEQPLLPYEACNLGSIVLSRMLKTGADGRKMIDWAKLEKSVRTAVHFLDNTIEMNKYPLKQIEEINKGNRKIGLGVMGFADMLIQLGISYKSQQALEVAEKVMKYIQDVSHNESCNLAKRRGNFKNFPGSVYDQKGIRYMRNATVTTIAPTGTTSIIANCSSGIEPIFALVYVRKNWLDNSKEDEIVEIHPLFQQVAKERWFYSKELMEEVAVCGSIQEIKGIPQDVKDLFVTAHDIDPRFQVKMQAVFQKYTDNAVSKTVNMKKESTVDDVKDVYMLAYETGCKGITIYRDSSRDKQVFNINRG